MSPGDRITPVGNCWMTCTLLLSYSVFLFVEESDWLLKTYTEYFIKPGFRVYWYSKFSLENAGVPPAPIESHICKLMKYHISLFLFYFYDLPSCRSTKDSSCFTVVLNNLRVFLIFDWLLLVHDFLHTPSDIKKQTKVTPSRHRNSSSESAVIPKTVKSGVVTKRSSFPVSTEKHLEVKVNVTGKYM